MREKNESELTFKRIKYRPLIKPYNGNQMFSEGFAL
jgi:hypothetical protein